MSLPNHSGPNRLGIPRLRGGAPLTPSQKELERFSQDYPYLALQFQKLLQNQILMTQGINRLTDAVRTLAKGEDMEASSLDDTKIYLRQGDGASFDWRRYLLEADFAQQESKQQAAKKEPEN